MDELTPLQRKLLEINDAAPDFRTAITFVQQYFDEKDSHFSRTYCETLLVRAKNARLMARATP